MKMSKSSTKSRPHDLRSAFGMHTVPFTRELSTDEQLDLPMQEEALQGMLRSLERRMSTAVIAPAGTGKTALIRRLLSQLPEARYRVRYVKVTDLSKRDLCREISAVCGVSSIGSYPALLRRLQESFEANLANDGLRPTLVLDEAHDLRPDVLSMLRVLTNFEMDSRLVLSLVLAGQTPLRNLLQRDDQQAIARRFSYYASLRPLSDTETQTYIEHRCSIAGAGNCPFDVSAVAAVFEISRGNLRCIDLLCLESLELAARAGHGAVSSNHIVAARKVLWP
jgi:general secretion pathway protein A